MSTTREYHLILANALAKWERRELNGRPHWVAPVRMIVPGVLNGSKGPLAYTPDDIRKAVNAWNGMPITLGHPQDEFGQYTSARRPEILDRYQLGQVLNVRFDKALDGEAWIDEQLAANKAPEVLNRIRNGQPIEQSTGLGTTDEEAPAGSVWNYRSGKKKAFTHYARNHQPDHLAVLLSQRGACSLDDGCGIAVNKGMCPECGEDSPDCECERDGDEPLAEDPTRNEGTLLRAWRVLVNAFKPNQPRSEVTGRVKKMTAGQGKGSEHEAAQEGYFGSIGAPHVKPGTQPPEPEEPTVNYIKEEGGKFCVYSEAGKKLGEYDTRGEAEKRLAQIEYFKHAKANQEDDEMRTRKEKVAFLVANCDCWKDKAELLGNEKLLDDKAIDGLVQNVQAGVAGKLAVNALKEVAKSAGADESLNLNEMPAFIKAKIDAKSGKDDEEKKDEKTANASGGATGAGAGTPTTMNFDKLTPEQKDTLSKALFGQTASQVQNGLNLLGTYERREKEIVVNRLTGHVKDPGAKAERAKKLMTLSLNELYDRLADLPVANEETTRRDQAPPTFLSVLGLTGNAGGSAGGDGGEVTFNYDEKWAAFDQPRYDPSGGGVKLKDRTAA